MRFPKFIQPNIFYKKVGQEILGGCCLIRHTNINDQSELIDSDTKEIKQIYICDPTIRMDDLSTNLLGFFKEFHTKLAITRTATKEFVVECSPNEKVRRLIFEKDFEINKSRYYFTIPVDSLIDKEVFFTKGTDTLNAKCVIQHTPMKWNYWHFSIRWRTAEGFIHELDDSKWKKRACSAARAHVAKFGTLGILPHRLISPKDFCKSRFSEFHFLIVNLFSRIMTEKYLK